LVQFIPKDFIFLGAIVTGIHSLISSVNSLLGYTEVHDFCLWVLHSSTLLNYLSFLMEFWWSVYGIHVFKSHHSKAGVTFLIYSHSTSFSCLIVPTRISITILCKSGEIVHSWLIPDFRRNVFPLPPFRMLLAIGF
jgi:hypothetical protein